jgi:hypothetical protein
MSACHLMIQEATDDNCTEPLIQKGNIQILPFLGGGLLGFEFRTSRLLAWYSYHLSHSSSPFL